MRHNPDHETEKTSDLGKYCCRFRAGRLTMCKALPFLIRQNSRGSQTALGIGLASAVCVAQIVSAGLDQDTRTSGNGLSWEDYQRIDFTVQHELKKKADTASWTPIVEHTTTLLLDVRLLTHKERTQRKSSVMPRVSFEVREGMKWLIGRCCAVDTSNRLTIATIEVLAETNAVISALSRPDIPPRIRATVLTCLAGSGLSEDAIAEVLAQATQHRDPEVREAAVRAASEMMEHRTLVPVVVRALRDPCLDVACAAVTVLVRKLDVSNEDPGLLKRLTIQGPSGPPIFFEIQTSLVVLTFAEMIHAKAPKLVSSDDLSILQNRHKTLMEEGRKQGQVWPRDKVSTNGNWIGDK